MEIFDILGPQLWLNFAQPSGPTLPVRPAKFDVNRCNDSPLRGEKPDFWPVSKFNTGSLPLRGILPVIRSPQLLLMVKQGIRGGVTTSSNRYAKSNNYMGDAFDRNKPSKFITYLDGNHLYGWAVSRPLPT